MWRSFTLLMISVFPLYMPCEGTVWGTAYKSLKSEKVIFYFILGIMKEQNIFSWSEHKSLESISIFATRRLLTALLFFDR